MKLNNRYRLVGEAKIWAAKEGIDNFLATTDRSLLVFAHHQSVQNALVERLNSPHILAGQKDIEAQKDLFASGKSRLIVCSLGAASVGAHTHHRSR